MLACAVEGAVVLSVFDKEAIACHALKLVAGDEEVCLAFRLTFTRSTCCVWDTCEVDVIPNSNMSNSTVEEQRDILDVLLDTTELIRVAGVFFEESVEVGVAVMAVAAEHGELHAVACVGQKLNRVVQRASSNALAVD